MASWQDYTYLKKIICKMTNYLVLIILNIYFLYNIFLSNISIKKINFPHFKLSTLSNVCKAEWNQPAD